MGTEASMAEPVALEVVLSWGGTVVGADVFEPRDRCVRIGTGRGADFALPIACDVSLATWTGGGWRIAPPPPEDAFPGSGPGAFELAPGEEATVTVAPELELRLRACPPPSRAFARVPRIERDLAGALLASFAVHACLVASAALTPSSVPMLELDRSAPLPERLRLFVAAEPVEAWPRPGPSPSARPRNSDPVGLAGDPRALRPRGGGRAVGRTAPTSVDVHTAGILGVLAALSRSARDGSSPYDVRLASAFEGGGPLDADLGPSRGSLGLGLFGVGRGACLPGESCDAMLVPTGNVGGGAGWGATCGSEIVRVRGVAKVVETCSAGLFGHGRGAGTGLASERGLDLGLRRGHEACVPTLRTVGATVSGGLTKEQVQRVIARGRVTLASCYARAAEAQPDLAGRFELVLVIAPSGAVQSATRGATELGPSPDLDRCVLSAARQWSFPASTGITLATHAIVLTPAGE